MNKEDEILYESLNQNELLEASLLLGQALEKHGDEARFVESTVEYFTQLYGAKATNVNALPTYITVSILYEGKHYSGIRRYDRINEYSKVDDANKFVKRLAEEGLIPLNEVISELQRINGRESPYPAGKLIRYIGMILACGSISYLSGGAISDIFPAGFAGAIGIFFMDLLDQYIDFAFLLRL